MQGAEAHFQLIQVLLYFGNLCDIMVGGPSSASISGFMADT